MKTLAFIKVDHVIDLITNSSSELFVIEAAKIEKKILVELINEALKGVTKISEDSIEERLFKEGHNYDGEWKIKDALELFPENDRDTIKEKYFTKPNYYGVVFDRDWVYNMYNDGTDVRGVLSNIGFELVDTDY